MPAKPAASNLWFGTDESYAALAFATESVAKLMASGEEAVKTAIKMAGGGGEDPFALPPLWDMQGNIAQVHINGSLINGDAGFMRLFGVTGYGDIAAALMAVDANPDAKQILLLIDSGGGAVSGLEEIGTLIQQIAKKKPVIAYTDGSMFSAAYWLGSSADNVYSTNVAQVGSVGTLIVHTEYSKQLADAGVAKTIVRYGKYKAMGNPYEPLSEEAKAQLQGLADQAGKIFVDYVSQRRGMSAEDFQAKAGEGRIFMGQKAKAAGLTDGVMPYSDMVKRMKTLDKKKTPPHNPRNSKDSAMKSQMSKKTIQAILGGAALAALGLSSPEANVEGVQLEAEALASLTAEATALIADVAAAAAAAAPAAVTAQAAAITAAVAPVQTSLDKALADLKAAGDKVTLLEAAGTALTGQLSASADLAAQAAEIVKASISVMSVSMGGAADSGASLVGPALLAEHARLKELFVKKFPAGGVAAVNAGAPEQKPVVNPGPSAQFRALVKPQA